MWVPITYTYKVHLSSYYLATIHRVYVYIDTYQRLSAVALQTVTIKGQQSIDNVRYVYILHTSATNQVLTWITYQHCNSDCPMNVSD